MMFPRGGISALSGIINVESGAPPATPFNEIFEPYWEVGKAVMFTTTGEITSVTFDGVDAWDVVGTNFDAISSIDSIPMPISADEFDMRLFFIKPASARTDTTLKIQKVDVSQADPYDGPGRWYAGNILPEQANHEASILCLKAEQTHDYALAHNLSHPPQYFHYDAVTENIGFLMTSGAFFRVKPVELSTDYSLIYIHCGGGDFVANMLAGEDFGSNELKASSDPVNVQFTRSGNGDNLEIGSFPAGVLSVRTDFSNDVTKIRSTGFSETNAGTAHTFNVFYALGTPEGENQIVTKAFGYATRYITDDDMVTVGTYVAAYGSSFVGW